MFKLCPNCGRTFDTRFTFCNEDGTKLVTKSPVGQPPVVHPPMPVNRPSPPPSPQIVAGNRWVRKPDQFAVRIEPADLKSLFTKGVVVEEGTSGLMFQNGEMLGVMQPGRYTIETVTQRLKNLVFNEPTSVVLIDVSDINLPFSIPVLDTSDDQNVSCEGQLVIAVQSPKDFYVNVMKGNNVVLTSEIAQRINAWAQEVIEPIVLSSTTDELSGNSELRERVEVELKQSLTDRLNRLGLILLGVDHIRFHSQTESEIRIGRGELNRKKALAEIDKAYKEFQGRLTQEDSKREMEKIEDATEFSQFLKRTEFDVFRRDLVRKQDRDELARSYLDRKHDIDTARAHLLAQIELQRRQELTRLTHEFEIDDIHRKHDQDLSRLKNKATLDDETRRQQQAQLDEELSGQIRRADQEFRSKLDHERKYFDWKLAAREAEERLGLAIEREKASDRYRDAEQALDLYKNMKSFKQQQAHEDQRLQTELNEKAKQLSHQYELERATKFNELSVPALIALSPFEQATLLTDLSKTETLQGMSELQIMALFAKDSPEIAQAMAEKFRSDGLGNQQANDRAEKMYERMLQEKDATQAVLLNMHQDTMRSQQELAQNAMNVQRDTAIAASTPVILAPASGVVNYSQLPTAATPGRTCPSCGVHSPARSRFCHSCGHAFA